MVDFCKNRQDRCPHQMQCAEYGCLKEIRDKLKTETDCGVFYRTEIARLKAALRPFAEAAENFDNMKAIKNPVEWFVYPGRSHHGGATGVITVADLRRARDAITTDFPATGFTED